MNYFVFSCLFSLIPPLFGLPLVFLFSFVPEFPLELDIGDCLLRVIVAIPLLLNLSKNAQLIDIVGRSVHFYQLNVPVREHESLRMDM